MLTAKTVPDSGNLVLPSDVLNDLNALELHIKASLNSEASILNDIPTYLLGLGGKRIRPLLVFLSAKLLNHKELSLDLLNIAAGIELIHMATLLHDDIIDKAPLRRNKESAFKKYGESKTLLAGNFLFVKAFGLCAKLDPFIIEQTESACVELTEGEVLEELSQFQIDQSLTISAKKTASLFCLAALSGVFVATKDKEPAINFSDFGRSMGIAFQISDDILDVISKRDVLGKEPGTDIRERKPSLVNCLWLKSGSTLAKEILVSGTSPTPNLIAESLSEIKDGSIIHEARQIGITYVERADRALEELIRRQPNHCVATTNLFKSLLQFALDRLN